MASFNVDSNINDLSGSFSNFASNLKGNVVQGIAAVRTALTLLAANPVGAVLTAIVVTVGALIAVLSRFQPVIDLFNAGMAAASAVVDVLADRIGALFGATERNTLSFREAAEAAFELERATQALADAEIRNITVSARRRVELADARLVAADATLSDLERIEALDRAATIQNATIDEEIRLRTEQLRILEANQGLSSNQREDDEAAALLQAELIDLDAMRLNGLREIEGQRSGLILRTQMIAAAELAASQAQALADQKVADQEAVNAQAEVDRIREIRQEREIDLGIAGGATEEEVFQLRLDRAETQEERDQILHEQTISRIEEEREAVRVSSEAQMESDMQVAEVAAATADSNREATAIAEGAKRDAIEATATAALNALTGLLGDSKGAQIAGLVATNAFEAAKLIVSGTTAAATATSAATAAAVPTLGASLAALPAQLAAITASTTQGLVGVGLATAGGIGQILASPGEQPSMVGSASTPSFGPTVTSPTRQEQEVQVTPNQMMAMLSEMGIEATITEGNFTNGRRNIDKKRQQRNFAR